MSEEYTINEFSLHMRLGLLVQEMDDHPKILKEDIEKRVEYKYGYILEAFELYGDFLDNIFENKHINPSEELRRIFYWVTEYSVGWMKLIYNEAIQEERADIEQRTRNPSKSIKQDIKIIEKFEELITDRFKLLLEENDIDKELLKEEYKDMFKERAKKASDIQELLHSVSELKQDLQQRRFKIFMKKEYYKIETVSKQVLSRILDDIISKYNISNCSLDKKQLIDKIPLPSELIETIDREEVYRELAIYLPDLTQYYNIPDK